jgi:hypothetical protein
MKDGGMKSIALLLILALYGCATTMTPQPIGGSRADGTVTLAFQYGIFEKPMVDWVTANGNAVERCKAWGYRNAQAFGGSQNLCLAYNGYGNCMRTQVNVTYQCTD